MLWVYLRHLDRARVEPTVAFLEGGAFEREVASLGVDTTVIPAGRLRQPVAAALAVRGLAGWVRERRPDIVLSWMSKAHLYAAPALALAGSATRGVWWQHIVTTGQWMDRLATLLPAHAIGCSSGVAACHQGRLVPSRPLFVVHPGIEAQHGKTQPGARNTLRKELGISSDRLVLGIVGRLQPSKGQHRFIEALAALRRRHAQVHGLIVGGDAHGFSPEYAQRIDELLAEHDLLDAVTVTGQVADGARYLQAMDVLVNASSRENLSLALIEGMRAGLPVVAVGDGGSVELVEDGVTGRLVHEPDAARLAEALEPLVVDRRLRARMGEAGRARMQQSFTAARMAAALTSNLHELADRAA